MTRPLAEWDALLSVPLQPLTGQDAKKAAQHCRWRCEMYPVALAKKMQGQQKTHLQLRRRRTSAA